MRINDREYQDCLRKKQYRNVNEARRNADLMARLHKKRYGVYRCRFCKFLHVGSMKMVTYFVDAVNGSDQNSGTKDDPFKTMKLAAMLVRKGDTVKVMPGVYSDPLVITTRDTRWFAPQRNAKVGQVAIHAKGVEFVGFTLSGLIGDEG